VIRSPDRPADGSTVETDVWVPETRTGRPHLGTPRLFVADWQQTVKLGVEIGRLH